MTPDQKRLVLTCLQIETERQAVKNCIYRTTRRPDSFLMMKAIEYNENLGDELRELAGMMPRKLAVPFPLKLQGDNDGGT